MILCWGSINCTSQAQTAKSFTSTYPLSLSTVIQGITCITGSGTSVGQTQLWIGSITKTQITVSTWQLSGGTGTWTGQAKYFIIGY